MITFFRLFVEQRPYGYGIAAHRGIKAICELAGIKDIYCKVGFYHLLAATPLVALEMFFL